MGCIIKRLITLTVPISNQRINLTYKGTDVTGSCLFSWSGDGVCWTNWVTYEQYTALVTNMETDFYLRILISTDFDTLFIGGCAVTCYTVCIYKENPYITDLCTNQTIDFYAGLDCALQMYNQLSNLVCCMIGIPCYYFRVLPDQDTADLTFKEYVLHNIVDMKYLKLVCQDGAMPSSKPMMTEYDFDWDSDWEVEISKDTFAKTFGDDAFPKQRDIIYIPMMKRMWEVNSAYDEKNEGFMWRPVTWKLGLVKWNEKTNVSPGDFEDVIDSWTQNRMDNFNAWADEEQLRETGITQLDAPKYMPENLTNLAVCDAVRATVPNTELHSTKHIQLNHRSAVVVRDVYDFKDPESVVTYQHSFCGDSGTVMFIIQPTGEHPSKILFGAGPIRIYSTGTTISFGDLMTPIEPGTTYLVHCRWNRRSFTTELNTYKYICTADPDMPPALIRPEMHIFDFNNPVASLVGPYNNDYIMDGPTHVWMSPAPDLITNIKVYECPLSLEDACRESLKYVTKDKRCVINDAARPFIEEIGFSVR